MTSRWAPDITVGALVAAFGLAETYLTAANGDTAILVVLVTAVAVGLSRRAPGVALVLVWLLAGGQLLVGAPVMLTELGIAAVAFGTARWGHPVTVWLSGLSIPAGAALAVVIAATGAFIGGGSALFGYGQIVDALYRIGGHWEFGAAVIGVSLLGAPWLTGLVLRVSDQAQTQAAVASADVARAEAERTQAHEVARVRESQARLARDVHDVVGHSLAVILAQAESAQYLPDEDSPALKNTLATIATSARTSLRDIRQVLSATGDPGGRIDDVDGLIESVRVSGFDVVSTQHGSPVPMPPESAMTAFRVLQEMLTNAIRHGRRDGAIIVQRSWLAEVGKNVLMIEVRNGLESTAPQPSMVGRGLLGMRERLESVGGRLELDRREEVFAARAFIPVQVPVPASAPA